MSENLTNDNKDMKYKTIICRHFNATGTCKFGDQCRYAHGPRDLRKEEHSEEENHFIQNLRQKSALNYKIAICKNWEKTGACKYGSHCTFAHGKSELREKKDNVYNMQPNFAVLNPPFLMDMNENIDCLKSIDTPSFISIPFYQKFLIVPNHNFKNFQIICPFINN